MPDLTVDYFRKDVAMTLLSKIDAFALDKWNDGFRNHLGASVIGGECARQIWYSFHWMAMPKHSGRMQRLFQRGHLEEFRYIEYLEGIGVEVWPLDPKTGKQFRVNKVHGHFGGSLDGIVSLDKEYGIPGYMLGEFKTKKDGSDFAKLKEKGIMLTNPQHYDQMSTYGAYYNLPYALYMSTNKNTDDMHIEVVPLNFKRAAEVERKAEYIITLRDPPPRISETPTYYKCKGCDFHGVCFDNHMPAKNCRSCSLASPVDDGQWFCSGYNAVIPDNIIRVGCPHWNGIKS